MSIYCLCENVPTDLHKNAINTDDFENAIKIAFCSSCHEGANREFECHNAIVFDSLSTKECEAFSNVSVFGVHTENGSFSQRTVFKFMQFRKHLFSQ